MSMSNKQHVDSASLELKGRWLQIRYLIAFTASLLNFLFYIMRVNLSVTIVAIALEDSNLEGVPKYEWDAGERGAVLSSFFWGYTAMQLPAIVIIRRFGPRKIGFILCILSSLATFIFVPAASYGWKMACLSRVLLGIFQSGLVGSIHELLSHWAPVQERSRMVVYSYCGAQIGTIASMAGSGIISDTLGWPWVYYLSGALGLIVAIIWLIFIYDSPSDHVMITPKEKFHIESSLAESTTKNRTELKLPVKDVLTSPPFLSLVAAFVGMSWGFWTLLTGIPSYLKGVLHFDIRQDGLLSSLPYCAMWIMGFFGAWLSDLVIKKHLCSVTIVRKIASSISLYGAALSLLILSFIEKDPAVVIILLVITVGLTGLLSAGLSSNQLDLAPNYASYLVGICNQLGCITAIISTLVTGFIVKDNSNPDQWRFVLLIAVGLYIIGNTLFVIFGSGKEQPWNKANISKSNQNEEEIEVSDLFLQRNSVS